MLSPVDMHDEDLPAVPRASGAWPTRKRAAREAALAWTNATEWALSDAVGWAVEHLVRAGSLHAVPWIHEPSVGVVRTAPAHDELFEAEVPPPELGPVLGARDFPRVYLAARGRVLATLRALLPNASDDRFVHAAIYDGRVERARGVWRARLDPRDAWSDQLLALFAADLLGDRDAYDDELTVCATCGRVGFEPEIPVWRRFGCADHTTPLRRETLLRRAG